jgi:hypothetical protein
MYPFSQSTYLRYIVFLWFWTRVYYLYNRPKGRDIKQIHPIMLPENSDFEQLRYDAARYLPGISGP